MAWTSVLAADYICRMKRIVLLCLGVAGFCLAAGVGAAPTVLDVDWKDSARERTLPLKVRIPDGVEKAPLVIFSHGLGGSREGGKAWGEYWSQNGYAVIHVQHPGSDQGIVKAGDGGVLQQLKRGATAEQLLGRVDDIRFVIDEIARRQKSGDVAVARIDLARIAMTGHSFGAATTMALANTRYPGPIKSLADSRITAFIALSPAVQGLKKSWPERYGEMSKPFFTITGTIDGDVVGNGANPDKRAAVFDAQPAGDKYRVVFEDGDHMVFNGGAIRENETFSSLIGDRKKRTDAATAASIQALTQTLTLKFLDAYLRGDSAAKAWLGTEAAKRLGAAGEWSVK
ncbi:MAG: dienelactone hydrolase [Betaproteobacteria bacterium]|nr:MAG: dienelactone hydrolase [Betaproteobacteria bacterium]